MLSGAVDILDDHTPTLMVTERGSVLLDLDGTVFARWRTLAAFDAFIEDVDRQREALDDDLVGLLRRSVEQAEWRKRSEAHRSAS